MRWGAIIIAISMMIIVLLGYRMSSAESEKFLLTYDMDGYQEIYEVISNGYDGYLVLGASAQGGESKCLISIVDSMGMMRRNLILEGPYCSSAYRGSNSYVIRMYDTLLSLDGDMSLLWKIHLDNRQSPDITDLIGGFRDSYYYAVSVDDGRNLHVLDTEGTLLRSLHLADGTGSIALEVDSCGHVHVALEGPDGGVTVMTVVDSGVVWSRVLDFGRLFGSERGIPVSLLWRKGNLYLFADAVRGEVSSPVYVVVMEEGDVEDYGKIDGLGSVGDAVIFEGGIIVGYNDPLGGFLVRFFDEDMEPMWSLKSDRGIIMDMVQGFNGQLVMVGNIPEEGNFFMAFADRNGKWITR